MSLHRYKNSS